MKFENIKAADAAHDHLAKMRDDLAWLKEAPVCSLGLGEVHNGWTLADTPDARDHTKIDFDPALRERLHATLIDWAELRVQEAVAALQLLGVEMPAEEAPVDKAEEPHVTPAPSLVRLAT